MQRHPNGVPDVPGVSPLQYQGSHDVGTKSTLSTYSKMSPGGMASQDAFGPPSGAPTPGDMGTPIGSWDPDCTASQLHPAIRSQYATMLQKQSPQPQSRSQPSVPAHLLTAAQNNCSPVHYNSQASSSPVQQQVSHLSTHEQHRSHHYPASSPVRIQPSSQHVSPPPPRAQQSPQAQQVHHTQLQPQSPRQPHAQEALGPLRSQAVASNGMSPGPDTQPSVACDGRGHRTQKTSPSTTQTRPPAPKQTFVPPPRPWERLQKAPQSPQNRRTAPGPPPTTTNGPQAAQGSAFHPHHVSGPRWQKLSQTMPNSNSHSRTPFRPDQAQCKKVHH